MRWYPYAPNFLRFCAAILCVTPCGIAYGQAADVSFLGENHVISIHYDYPSRGAVYEPNSKNPASRTITRGTDSPVAVLGDEHGDLVKVTVAFEAATIEFSRPQNADNAWAAATFHGVTIQDSNAKEIGTVEIDASKSILPAGFDASRIASSGNSVYVNFEGLAPWAGQKVVLVFGATSKHGYMPVEHYQLTTFCDHDEAVILVDVRVKDEKTTRCFSTGSMPLDRAMRLLQLLAEYKHETRYDPGLKEFKFGEGKESAAGPTSKPVVKAAQ